VAKGIARKLSRRQQKKVFSAIGRVQALIIRLSTWIFRMISGKF